jgi:exopolyphosphatase/pppGpp-phosphohydrolase
MVAKALPSWNSISQRGTAMDRATFARPHVDSDRFPAANHPYQDLQNWVRRRVGNIDHERRVLQIAEALYDLTADLHGLGRRAKWALSASALIHDVGRSVDPDEHPEIGANLILSDSALTLPAHSRRWLAYLTLHHRGPVPDLGEDEILRPTDDRAGLLKVLGLLRAADTLDSRAIDPPRLLMMRRNRQVQVRCLIRERSTRAERAFCRPKKYRLMEETLGCSLDVDVQLGDSGK